MPDINTLINIPITNLPRKEVKKIQFDAIKALLYFEDDNAYVFSLLQTIISSAYNLGYIDGIEDLNDELHNNTP